MSGPIGPGRSIAATGAPGSPPATRWVRGRERGASETIGEEALLQLDDGKWGMSVPTPQPSMLRNARGERVPALAVPLFQARF